MKAASRQSRKFAIAISCSLLFAASLAVNKPVAAQNVPRTYPPNAYYQSKGILQAGELRDAAKAFRSAASQGYITGNGRSVDSICYYAMIGECLYQAGNLQGAMEQYDAALNLYLSNPRWVKNVTFPAQVAPANSVVETTRINWGRTTRTTTIADVPDTMSVLIANDVNQALQQGGLVQNPELRLFNVHEILRCTALAMSRRFEIMGMLSKHDPFARKVADTASGGVGSQHPFALAWSNLLHGIGLASMGEDEKAAVVLQAAIQAGDRYDHPLTPLTLLELAKLNFRNGKIDAAEVLALEATYSAAIFDNQDVMVEAFRLGTTTHLLNKRQGIYPPLDPASAWARTKGSKQLEATLPLLAAQCLTESGASADAATLIAASRKPMNRNDLANSVIGTDFLYRSAQVSFQQGNLAAGLTSFDRALKSQFASSKWLYQISVADSLYVNGIITPHTTNEIFEWLLREPRNEDWLADPVETLTYVASTQLRERQHWFEIAIVNKEYERALEMADSIRRHRFYSSLPIGGRMLALRWMLEAPENTVTLDVAKMRQAFLLKYPQYENLADASRLIQTELRTMPLVPDEDSDDLKKQRKLLEQWEAITNTQEAFLADVALRREPSPFVFPPSLNFKDVQSGMAEGQVVLSFLSTDRGVYSFLMTRDKFALQELADANQVKKQLVDLLRKLGHLDPNNQISAETFAETEWRAPAQELMNLLLPKATPEFWDSYNELVIVPDGLLWYLPFEILQVGQGAKAENLYDKISIRYAPTVSTAVSDKRPIKAAPTIAFVTGKLFLRDDLQVSSDAFDKIKVELPTAEKLPFKLPGSSHVLSALCDQLVVWDDVEDSLSGSAYDWSPMQIDRGKTGSSVMSWMGLPWSGPEQIILPGFHTDAASSLKRRGTGDEIFLTACGMMATGARTILLSRWRVGGDSAYRLTEKMLVDMPSQGPMSAWRASVDDLVKGDIDIEKEPRIKKSAKIDKVSASHPFFWAGYMLIDTGGKPNR